MHKITYGTRFSFERVDKAQEHNGFTKFSDSVIAKVGKLDYSDNDEPNGVRVENRSPEELFSESHLDSLSGAPLTMIHPDEMVDGVNFKEHIVGTILNPRQDGDSLVADILVYDSSVVEKIKAGTAELSEGYLLDDLIKNDELGHYEQTGMTANHVAIVPKGRCGGSCRLNFDAKTGIIKSDTITSDIKNKDEEMVIFHYDGIDYDIGTPEGNSPLVNLLEDMKNRNDTLREEVKLNISTLETANVALTNKDGIIADLQAKVSDEALNKRVDALMVRKEHEQFLAGRGIKNLDKMSDSEMEIRVDAMKFESGREKATTLNKDANNHNGGISKRDEFMKAQKNK